MVRELEQILVKEPTQTQFTVDVYEMDLVALYTFGSKKKFGLTTGMPFQGGYDLPGTSTQLHLHGPNPTTITHAHIVDYNRNVMKNLNGYQASMASFNANNLGLPKIEDPMFSCRKKF